MTQALEQFSCCEKANWVTFEMKVVQGTFISNVNQFAFSQQLNCSSACVKCKQINLHLSVNDFA